MIRRRELGIVLALLTILGGAHAALAQSGSCSGCNLPTEDTVLCGCMPAAPGELGAPFLVANVGETITVPVVLHANTDIDAFGLDLQFPSDLLAYDTTLVGKATEFWDFFAGNLQSSQNVVRVGGFEAGPDTVEAGNLVVLAEIKFLVTNPGCGDFVFTNLFDDLSGYEGCAITATVDAPVVAPLGVRSVSAHPNPFDEAVAIDFSLVTPSKVWIDVYDAAGRRVASLLDGRAVSAGGRQVWSGLDRHGRPVPAGVYFVRLKTETESRNLKVLRVK